VIHPHEFTPEELETVTPLMNDILQINSECEAEGIYPIIVDTEEILDYVKFQEETLKPIFYNFKSLYSIE